MAVVWLPLPHTLSHHWLQMSVHVQLYVWPIHCESCMQFYFWLRPYQDTGLAAVNHSFIHEHTNKWTTVRSRMDALVSLVQLHHVPLRGFTQYCILL